MHLSLKNVISTLGIKLGPPFPVKHPSCFIVRPGVDCHNNKVVLKEIVTPVSMIDPAINDEFCDEIAALDYFDSEGAVELITADLESGWLLENQCLPGIPLVRLGEDEATNIFVDVMQVLHRPLKYTNHKFKHISYWLERLNKDVVVTYQEKASEIAQELLNSSGEDVLLHGDLHHENILSAGDDCFLAIDPKGIIGEREFEVGAFMRNPYILINSELNRNLKKIINRRLDIITERTAFDRNRLKQWCYVQCILSACWHVDSNTKKEDLMLKCAELF